MDHRQFDRIARQMATAGDRRVLLRAALAATATLAGARLGGTVAQDACAEGCSDGQVCVNGGCVRPCENHRDCRSKKDDPCISNTCVDGVCVEAIIDCLPGYECCKGECCAKGCASDTDCTVFDPCRLGTCGVDGQCQFTQLDPCVVCSGPADCPDPAAPICCGGTCLRPCPTGSVMGKGCECSADDSAALNGLVARDDASGSTGDYPGNRWRQSRRSRSG
jgi:hypothetical protein